MVYADSPGTLAQRKNVEEDFIEIFAENLQCRSLDEMNSKWVHFHHFLRFLPDLQAMR